MPIPSPAKPVIPPAATLAVSIAFKFTLQKWGGSVPSTWIYILIGAAMTWLVIAILRNSALVKKYPSVLEWLPFLEHGHASVSDLSNTHIEGKTFRLVDAAVGGHIVGKTFDNCVILGPAVMAAAGFTCSRNPTHKVRSRGGFFFQLDRLPSGDGVAKDGVVVVEDCTFNNCTFDNIGVAGADEDAFVSGLGPQGIEEYRRHRNEVMQQVANTPNVPPSTGT